VSFSPAQLSLYWVLSRVLEAGCNRGVLEPVLPQEHAELILGHGIGHGLHRREPRIPGDLDEEFFRCTSDYSKCETVFCHRSAFLGLRGVGSWVVFQTWI
jgi:hypothetical protein